MRPSALLAIAATLLALHAQADLPTWKRECGSCHIAFPPRLLSMASWHAVMGGLADHFGVDASLDPARRASILAFLALHAGDRDTSVDGEPLLRITETRRFQREHREEIAGRKVLRDGVKSPADCGACHVQSLRRDHAGNVPAVPGGHAR